MRPDAAKSEAKANAFIGSTMAQCLPDFGYSLGQQAVGVFASDRPENNFNPTALSSEARALYNRFAAAWRQSDRDAVAASFKPVLHVGGGVYYFYNFLKQRIPHLSRPDDPIHANALGYCSLAGRLLMRKVQANGAKV